MVGARCAGSPTATLLARKGYRVLVVDQATFPSDTISTHLIHPAGISALKVWDLLDRLVASGCPGIDTYVFDFGRSRARATLEPTRPRLAYAPRRTVLDRLPVDAASEAGAEVREGFVVEDLEVEDGRVTGTRAQLQVSYYTYVSGLPMGLGATRSTFARIGGSQPGPRTTIGRWLSLVGRGRSSGKQEGH